MGSVFRKPTTPVRQKKKPEQQPKAGPPKKRSPAGIPRADNSPDASANVGLNVSSNLNASYKLNASFYSASKSLNTSTSFYDAGLGLL